MVGFPVTRPISLATQATSLEQGARTQQETRHGSRLTEFEMLAVLALVVAGLLRLTVTYQVLFQAHKPNSIPLVRPLARISAIQADPNSHLNNSIRPILRKDRSIMDSHRNGNQVFRVLLLQCIRLKGPPHPNSRNTDTAERHRMVKHLPSLMDMVLHRPSRTMVVRIEDERGLCASPVGSSAADVFPTIKEQ